jgi:hypothetical protein
MSMQTITLFITIIGILVAFIGQFTNLVFSVAGLVITLIGSVLQYLTTQSFILHFSEKDWQEQGGGFSISIHPKRHFLGHHVTPTIQQKRSDGSFETVSCYEQVEADGSLTIRSSTPFIGKVILK